MSEAIERCRADAVVAPPEFIANIRQFEASGKSPTKYVFWVFSKSEQRTDWPHNCDCQWLYRVTEESTAFLLSHGVSKDPGFNYFVCPCQGRLIE